MLVKVILLFLLVMALIGMIGRALFPSRAGAFGLRLTKKRAQACKRCGRHLIGSSGCDCGKG